MEVYSCKIIKLNGELLDILGALNSTQERVLEDGFLIGCRCIFGVPAKKHGASTCMGADCFL